MAALEVQHDKPLLTLPEAADLLRLKVSTLRAWVLRRKFPYLKVGRCVRLRRSDLEAYLSQALIPAREVRTQ